jgi:modification methylase
VARARSTGATLLKPGGVVAVVARPWRRARYLVDLPGQIIGAGLAAGLHLVACRRAVHVAVRDGRFIAGHSFFQLHVARTSRTKGSPVGLIQHDDISVFQCPVSSASSGEPKCSQRKPELSRDSSSHVDTAVHGEADGGVA